LTRAQSGRVYVEPVIVVVAFLFGVMFGSFLNVVITRVPAGESVVRPASRCPSCRTPIAVRDNLPIVSWLALRGRCRYCGWRIPVRYPFVELGCGLGLALVAVLVL